MKLLAHNVQKIQKYKRICALPEIKKTCIIKASSKEFLRRKPERAGKRKRNMTTKYKSHVNRMFTISKRNQRKRFLTGLTTSKFLKIRKEK